MLAIDPEGRLVEMVKKSVKHCLGKRQLWGARDRKLFPN
jgi:hypothetical protein